MRRLAVNRHLLAGLAWIALASPALAADEAPSGPLSGKWRYEYSCARATGLYADRCAAGLRDYFELSIAQAGGHVCGWYAATSQMGNHADEGELTDWAFTSTSDRTFHVHFHLSGTVGEADISLAGNELHWEMLTEQPDGTDDPLGPPFSPPKSATLVRQPADPVRCPTEQHRHHRPRTNIPGGN